VIIINIEIIEYTNEKEFINLMLYHAIFWDKSKQPPSIADSQNLDFVRKPLNNWMEREGDFALVAFHDLKPVGAVWYRFWEEKDEMRGYINESSPVLVIGLTEQSRGHGIGEQLMNTLFEQARLRGVKSISLSVSKSNYALKLYQKTGFEFHADIGDSILMLKTL